MEAIQVETPTKRYASTLAVDNIGFIAAQGAMPSRPSVARARGALLSIGE